MASLQHPHGARRWQCAGRITQVATFALWARLLTAAIVLHPQAPARSAEEMVKISVNAAARHQRIHGFGATVRPLIYGRKDYLSPTQRASAIEILFKDVRMSTGNLDVPNLEVDANDDNDPQHLNRGGFDLRESRRMKEQVVDPAAAYGKQAFYLDAGIDLRRVHWLKAMRHSDYQRYLDEWAEHVLATVKIWRDDFGFTSRYVMLFNEPLTGNRELAGGTIDEVIDIIKRTGERLRREGFGHLRFVVPNEETEQASLDLAAAILADPQARPWVGVIAYHPYPYGSAYASVPKILRSSGAGQPVGEAIAVRAKLRDLARKYNVPLWMTEVSHSEVGALSFDALLGRAIHIHDEFVYADAAAYFGMHAMWDSWSHRDHFPNNPAWNLFAEGDTLVLIDKEVDRIHITGMGYAIGHYARWIERHVHRVAATSSDALVLVTAFHDETHGRLTLVVINNHPVGKQIAFAMVGGTMSGAVSGEESTATARWKPLAQRPANATVLLHLVAPKSVTTLAIDGFALRSAKQ